MPPSRPGRPSPAAQPTPRPRLFPLSGSKQGPERHAEAAPACEQLPLVPAPSPLFSKSLPSSKCRARWPRKHRHFHRLSSLVRRERETEARGGSPACPGSQRQEVWEGRPLRPSEGALCPSCKGRTPAPSCGTRACPHLLTIPPGPWLDRTLRRRSEGPKGGRWAARHSVVSRKPFYSSGSGIQQTPSLGLSGPWGPSDVGLPSWGSLFLLSASYHQDCLWGGVACPIQVEGLRALRILDAIWCPLFPVQPGANPSPPSTPHFGYGRVSAGGQQRGPAVTQAPGALALSLLSPSPWEGVESFLSPAGRHIEIASRLWGGLTTWTLDLKVGSLCL